MEMVGRDNMQQGKGDELKEDRDAGMCPDGQ